MEDSADRRGGNHLDVIELANNRAEGLAVVHLPARVDSHRYTVFPSCELPKCPFEVPGMPGVCHEEHDIHRGLSPLIATRLRDTVHEAIAGEPPQPVPHSLRPAHRASFSNLTRVKSLSECIAERLVGYKPTAAKS